MSSYKLQDYNVLEMLEEGVFGQVLHCFNPKTSDVVALKVLKEANESDLLREVAILKLVRELGATKHNIVMFFDHFSWNGYNCMAFEMLDCSLSDFRKKTTFSLSKIRVVTHQLLVAFDALKQKNIIHTDLKAENVKLVNHKYQPFTVRLTDFGLAQLKSELKIGAYVQPSVLRAPEVNLGFPLTEAIDMWALGCLLIKLYVGYIPFSGDSEYNHLRTIVNMLGHPPDDLLSDGVYTGLYYNQTSDGQWRLMSPEEYTNSSGQKPRGLGSRFEKFVSVESVILSTSAETEFSENTDRLEFVNLVRELLNLDYRNRITPSEALKHPFITLDHFEEKNIDDEYVQLARCLQNVVLKNNTTTEASSTSGAGDHSNQDVKEESQTPHQHDPENTTEEPELDQTEGCTPPVVDPNILIDDPVALKEDETQPEIFCSENTSQGELTFVENFFCPFELDEGAALNTKDHEDEQPERDLKAKFKNRNFLGHVINCLSSRLRKFRALFCG